MLKLGAVRQAVVVNDTGYAKNAHVRTFRVQIFRRFVPWNALDVWVRYQQIDALFLTVSTADPKSPVAITTYPALSNTSLRTDRTRGAELSNKIMMLSSDAQKIISRCQFRRKD
jgi:hypothetical protein